MNQSDQGRRLRSSQLSNPSLYPARATESLPTITTLNASSSSYPTQNTIPSAQRSASVIEDELHSESDSQLANTKQESGEGGTTSDFVKKLYKCVFGSKTETSEASQNIGCSRSPRLWTSYPGVPRATASSSKI